MSNYFIDTATTKTLETVRVVCKKFEILVIGAAQKVQRTQIRYCTTLQQILLCRSVRTGGHRRRPRGTMASPQAGVTSHPIDIDTVLIVPEYSVPGYHGTLF